MICAPISDHFSRTQTLTSQPLSAAHCFRRIAAARPDGPPPTTTTSYSMLSRWISSAIPGTQAHSPYGLWGPGIGAVNLGGTGAVMRTVSWHIHAEPEQICPPVNPKPDFGTGGRLN